MLKPLPFSWRLSRYEPQLRASREWESWTDRTDVGHSFNGFVLTEEEYLRIEDAYIAAATRFAVDVSASVFRVVYVGHQSGQYALVAGQTVIRSDLGPLVRGNLRGDLDCAIESTEGLYQLAFGYDRLAGGQAQAGAASGLGRGRGRRRPRPRARRRARRGSRGCKRLTIAGATRCIREPGPTGTPIRLVP